MSVSTEIRHAIEDFLYQEAELLDNGAFREWEKLLTEDMRYEAPVRITREREKGPGFVEDMRFFDEDRDSIDMRIARLETDAAWAEDPPSRTRHFVTNIRIRPGEKENEYLVKSNVLLWRTRGDAANYDLLAYEREDTVRQVDGAWKLACRRILVDFSTVPTHNLSVFL